jgi:hypothetical protein
MLADLEIHRFEIRWELASRDVARACGCANLDKAPR